MCFSLSSVYYHYIVLSEGFFARESYGGLRESQKCFFLGGVRRVSVFPVPGGGVPKCQLEKGGWKGQSQKTAFGGKILLCVHVCVVCST